MQLPRLPALLAAAFAAVLSVQTQAAAVKDHFSVCWTIYAGWMPWEYAGSQGILDKWAKKYGIKIDMVQLNDYVESINQYTAGQFDGCTMTNMDALTIPAAGGVDSTALVVSDFSNGNDGVVIKGTGKTVADLKGMNVNLVELSVSHYLLARALESADLSEKDLKVVNTSDADIAAAFNTDQVQAVTTWNPMLSEIKAKPESSASAGRPEMRAALRALRMALSTNESPVSSGSNWLNSTIERNCTESPSMAWSSLSLPALWLASTSCVRFIIRPETVPG